MLVLAAVLCAVLMQNAAAQELSPRAYWPTPYGTKLLIAGYSYTTGDIATDPSLPVFGVDSKINTGIGGYLQTLSLFGRTANFILEVPYTWGSTIGSVEDELLRRDFSGLGDIGVTLSVNLLGGPSMSPAAFQALRKDPHPILGASLKVLAPTGNYDAQKLINVGANRWAVKTEFGYMIPLRPKLLLELELGAWFFSDNEEFLGTTREQDPVYAIEGHLVRRFSPGFWGSVDFNYYRGGQSVIGGNDQGDLQRNSKIGGTLVIPFARRYAVKLGYSTGVVTRSGGDFDTFLVSLQTILP
jgi:hypothetical protein